MAAVPMKTRHTNTNIQPAKKLPAIPATSVPALIVALLLFVTTATPVLAVDAVWLFSPLSDVWNTGTNWAPPSAPVNPGDTATFNTSTQTSLILSRSITIESITFEPAASAFTINTSGKGLTLEGAGIVNNSGKTQAIINNEVRGAFGVTAFLGTSTAGSTAITNNGGPISGVVGGGTFSGAFGVTAFFNT
jgi:hypothetical protein